MFSQSSKSAEPQTQAAQPAQTGSGAKTASTEPSIISADLRVVGDLHCSGDLQVKGNVEGDIKSRSVTIGEGAHVQGSVAAETVHISGSIKGQIEAPAVTVARSARVIGDIVHQTLAIEAGAHLEGNIRRLEAAKTGQAAGVSAIKPGLKGEPLEAGKKAAS